MLGRLVDADEFTYFEGEDGHPQAREYVAIIGFGLIEFSRLPMKLDPRSAVEPALQ